MPLKNIKIDILNVNFFDWDGVRLYNGGAERYVRDIASLCKKLGHDVRIVQFANHYFEKTIEDIRVIGIEGNKSGWDFESTSRLFNSQEQSADLLITSPLDLACNLDVSKKIIGINHGVYWDDGQLSNKSVILPPTVIKAVKKSNFVVCVDTNFINNFRIYDNKTASEFIYLPNYVDNKIFNAPKKDFYQKNIKFLFSRRINSERGIYLVISAFDRILNEYEDVSLTLCGQVEPSVHDDVEAFLERHGDRVEQYVKDFDEISIDYQDHHISLIPTIRSEGTSLSCIESMAAGCPVIATNVGGLPNLVIDHFNGILINPTEDSLYCSVKYLLENRELCDNLSRNAVEIAKTFDKTIWEKNWQAIIEQAIQA